MVIPSRGCINRCGFDVLSCQKYLCYRDVDYSCGFKIKIGWFAVITKIIFYTNLFSLDKNKPPVRQTYKLYFTHTNAPCYKL